jgi:aspartokinase
MFRPNFKAAALPVRHRRPTKSPYFRHGELTQRIFDALRERGEISSADVAAQAMRDKGLDADNDRVTRTDFVRRVGLQLNALQRDRKIERIGKGRTLRWRLSPSS